MSDRFDQCLAFILTKEGGKVDDPVDRGGRTNKGVTQVTYDVYRANRSLPKKDVWDIEDNEVRDIYFNLYWNSVKCGRLPPPLDLAVFDAAINCGVRRVSKWLQQALGMEAGSIDGVIGAGTLRHVFDATIANDIPTVFNRFQSLRNQHYIDLVTRDPKQERFLKGWQNRVASVNRAANLGDNVA